MSQADSEINEVERAELLAQIKALQAEIKLITQRLVAHGETPNFFKDHPVVREIVK